MRFYTQTVGVVRFLDLIRELHFTRSSTAADSEKTVSYTARLVASLVPKAVNSQPPSYQCWRREEPENEAASNVRMRTSLCPDSLAVFFFPPDANHYWTPESSDRHNEGLPKA